MVFVVFEDVMSTSAKVPWLEVSPEANEKPNIDPFCLALSPNLMRGPSGPERFEREAFHSPSDAAFFWFDN